MTVLGILLLVLSGNILVYGFIFGHATIMHHIYWLIFAMGTIISSLLCFILAGINNILKAKINIKMDSQTSFNTNVNEQNNTQKEVVTIQNLEQNKQQEKETDSKTNLSNNTNKKLNIVFMVMFFVICLFIIAFLFYKDQSALIR